MFPVGKKIAASAAMAGLLLSTFTATSAVASEALTKDISSPVTSTFVLDSDAPGVEITDTEVFYPLPKEAEHATIIGEELAAHLDIEKSGIITGQASTRIQTEVQTQLRANELSRAPSGWTPYYVPPGTKMSTPVKRNLALIGSHVGTQTYQWRNNTVGSQSKICAVGNGFVRVYGTNGYIGVARKSYSLGCGASGSHTVPWQSVSDFPRFAGKPAYLKMGQSGDFR